MPDDTMARVAPSAPFAAAYHALLCPDPPAFIAEYARIPLLRRLSGVGLLCGTDWTPLFRNAFFYSRLEHSVGTALITWNFTHDRAQTVASLLHDVATPAFSHVGDFRNGDALTQESTEAPTRAMIAADEGLLRLLDRDGLAPADVDDYHRYPVADNAVPGLSADRLEYMYPSGAVLCGAWTLPEIARNYAAVRVLRNERGLPELGFADEAAAVAYTKRFCAISRLLQQHEDKVSMQLLADILTCAVQEGILQERELYAQDEAALIARFDARAAQEPRSHFARLVRTFRGMRHVLHVQEPLDGCYTVSLPVKRRYVDPLVQVPGGDACRASALSPAAARAIQTFLAYDDTPVGCVRWL